MNKTKEIIVVVVHVLLVVFVLVAIWPAITGNNDAYVVNDTNKSELSVIEETATPVVTEAQQEVEIISSSINASPVEESMAVTSDETVTTSTLYTVIDGDKLDVNSYAGFKLYRNWCARCHGTYGQGMVGPNLADSLKVISKDEFLSTVENGKTGTIGSMPAWKSNPKVMAGRDQIYAYLMARSDGAIGEVKPKKQ